MTQACKTVDKDAYTAMFGSDSDSEDTVLTDVEDERFWEESGPEEVEESQTFNPDHVVGSFNASEGITFPDIPGLVYYPELFSHTQQTKLVEAVIAEQYFATPEMNQAMRFGDLPESLTWVIDSLRSISDLFPEPIRTRMPLFDQTIINLYRKGDGIKSHVDLARFEDGIVIISLLSSCIMSLKPASTHPAPESVQAKDIYLRPGDVLSLSGTARYDWEHGIPEREYDIVDGVKLERGTRLSVTFRRLIKGCGEGFEG
ncbi:hypothetical protein K493DRAFT_86752 [Basidiobolus meristosporus CBS 931.73]|uniref:Fe2OG dioxygenase domain-containing protein n=1 Tax=Basidiobolus meristosporus CBS 931.73 TaxID=1314790 RepID=A0A1Y1XGG0_9FUNG|nr:hypothetical protein K493DRAFT_86752 [Basidiobolus meristosporus CBS 931.73]|eukprot:ORX84782.1 hypothetical protein K493DRAFT_86752 [Basidiobolus meristosporus CBS 931.73]